MSAADYIELIAARLGKVRGEGIFLTNFDFGRGFSTFVQAEVRGGSGLFGAGGRIGARLQRLDDAQRHHAARDRTGIEARGNRQCGVRCHIVLARGGDPGTRQHALVPARTRRQRGAVDRVAAERSHRAGHRLRVVAAAAVVVVGGGADNVDLSANGNRLRFFRNPGNITMDTAGVERVDFNALGGPDSITVSDLTGTDVGTVNLDLASTLGGGQGNGQADHVLVEGTNDGDRIRVNSASDERVFIRSFATRAGQTFVLRRISLKIEPGE